MSQNPPIPRTVLGMLLATFALFMFASQDAITKTLVTEVSVSTVVFTRYTAFVIFAMVLSITLAKGKIHTIVRTENIWGQVFRGLILVTEIFIFAWGVRYLDISLNHALFSIFPLVITALAWPLLGERVGPWRWGAVIAGFIGALIIIRPGTGTIGLYAIFPILAACMYASYNIVTRMTGRSKDSFATSWFYLSVVGWIAILPFGIIQFSPLVDHQIWLLFILCVSSVAGHSALIAALMFAPASTLQPLNYLLLVFATLIGITIFQERPDVWTYVGSAIIVASGLFVFLRERIRMRRKEDSPHQGAVRQ